MDVGEVVRIEIEPRWDPQRKKRRRQEVQRAREGTFDSVSPWGLSSPVKKRTMEGGGRRHEGRRGRPLDVLVEWEGEDSDGGDLWEESWVSITDLSKDLREEARRLESELFGSRGTRPLSRRAERRNEVRQRQERERSDQQWSSRLRDRARGAPA